MVLKKAFFLMILKLSDVSSLLKKEDHFDKKYLRLVIIFSHMLKVF